MGRTGWPSHSNAESVCVCLCVQMGRYFLALAEERDEELNNCTAVTWLVQAAKQGRKDAVKTLQQCLASRKGTNISNWLPSTDAENICPSSVCVFQASLWRTLRRWRSCAQRRALREESGKLLCWCTGSWTRRGRSQCMFRRCWRTLSTSTQSRVTRWSILNMLQIVFKRQTCCMFLYFLSSIYR